MTSFRRHVPNRFFINQCQIITFLILKSDNIENSRVELKGIVLPVPSNQIKATFLLFYPSTWYICDFFLFHIEIEGLCGWIIGGAKGYVAPPPPPHTPLKLLGEGGRPPAPPVPPSSYAYVLLPVTDKCPSLNQQEEETIVNVRTVKTQTSNKDLIILLSL